MSFHNCISQTLLFGQFLGLMPVVGICHKDSSQLKFSWKSLRFYYSIIISSGSFIFLVFTIIWTFISKNMSLGYFIVLIVYAGSFINVILFYKVGKQWPKLIHLWNVMEMKISFDSKSLQKSMNMILVVVVTAAVAEYTFQSLTVLAEASKCGWEHQTKVFYLTTYPHIFHHIKYSPVIGFIAKVMSYFITITWAYRDLFIINISLAFIAAFRQINIELRASRGRDMMPDYYWKYRSIYMELRRLVNDFDDSINGITMLAIGKNTFIICAHLFKSLYFKGTALDITYFWFSNLSLIIRTFVMGTIASDLHEESKEPLKVFRAIPRAAWCTEVSIFNHEVMTDTIAFTGLKQFSFTRKLLLSITAKIITYEIFLIQLKPNAGSIEDAEDLCKI